MSYLTGGSGDFCAAVVPSDTVDLPAPSLYILATIAGNISVDTIGGAGITQTAVIMPIAVGQMLPLRAKRIRATGTTATGIFIIW